MMDICTVKAPVTLTSNEGLTKRTVCPPQSWDPLWKGQLLLPRSLWVECRLLLLFVADVVSCSAIATGAVSLGHRSRAIGSSGCRR